MRATIELVDGTRTALPELERWSIRQTDGDPCGSFTVEFAYTQGWLPVLERAVRFFAEENGTRVFTGVVDDFAVRLDRKGLMAEVTGRSPAAWLMDNQVQAAEFVSAQLEDILRLYVRPYGITQIDAQAMPAVGQFTVETGYSCWQVLTGFCRHSAEVFPRFTAEGVLVLRQETAARSVTVQRRQVLSCRYVQDRYGVASRQVLVNTRGGTQQVAENAEFLALGGRCVHVAGRTGSRVRATWRTAQQRLDDSARQFRTVELRLMDAGDIQPLDRVTLALPQMGLAGTFTVQSVSHDGSETGVTNTLMLR